MSSHWTRESLIRFLATRLEKTSEVSTCIFFVITCPVVAHSFGKFSAKTTEV